MRLVDLEASPAREHVPGMVSTALDLLRRLDTERYQAVCHILGKFVSNFIVIFGKNRVREASWKPCQSGSHEKSRKRPT